MATKEQIFKSRPPKTESVVCPEWDCTVTVKAISGTERDSYEAGLSDEDGKRTAETIGNMRARLLVLAIVNGDGNPIFSLSEATRLGEEPASAIDRCFQAAKRLAGIGEEKVIEKNSGGEASGVSA